MILYIGNMLLASHAQRMEYIESFSQVQHPQNTSMIGSLSLKIEYYPATYVEDSFRFKTAYLVGELRNYSGNWNEIKKFYSSKRLDEIVPIMLMPVEVHRNDQQAWLDIASGSIFSPFEADILSAINNQASFEGILKNLTGTERDLYLVYGVW
jgi:hypothetical protein